LFSTTLTQPLLPLTVTETHQNVLCFGANNGSIDLTVTGGTPNYTYLWNTGSTNQDLSSLIAGNYSVLVTDANNCIVNLPINISQPSAPLTLSSNVTNVDCFGLASGAIDITVNGGTAPFTYFWNTGAVSQDLINIPAGQYTIAVTDFNNCVSSTIINLSQPASALSVSVNSTDISCFGYSDGTALLSISGGSPAYDILWNTGATTNFINNLPAGSYSATITDANGCENNVNIQLNQPAAIVPSFTYTINGICSPVSVEFTNTSQGSPTNCIWELGNGESVSSCGNFTYSYSEPGCYSVTLNTTLNNGCSSSLTLDSIICVQPGPTADFIIVQSSDVYYSGNVQFNNSSVNADFYTWDFGDNTPTSEEVDPLHNYGTMSSNTYDVTLIAEDSLGCIDTAIISFTIEEDFMVYVPNTFTLDNNNANEAFIPVFSDINDVKQYELLIFDRWGELIWQSTDKYTPWDGIYKGKKCQDGVYTWKLTYTRENNYIAILVGHVNLLR
jgi:gliding motility-associated-like protein